MTADELKEEIRKFAKKLAGAMGSAEQAAHNNNPDGLMNALRDAKTAADDLARSL